jgi:hypothetical protein
MLKCLLLVSFLWAQDHDAIKQTQGVLTNKKDRQKAIQELPESAKKVDQNVDIIVGGDENQKEEMYQISADIFKNFEGKSAEEMQKILEQAQKDPEAFYKSLSPEQQKKIKGLANKIESKKKAKP